LPFDELTSAPDRLVLPAPWWHLRDSLTSKGWWVFRCPLLLTGSICILYMFFRFWDSPVKFRCQVLHLLECARSPSLTRAVHPVHANSPPPNPAAAAPDRLRTADSRVIRMEAQKSKEGRGLL
jgi:hypothetical protein